MQKHNQTFVLLSKPQVDYSTWDSAELGAVAGPGEQVSACEGWAGTLVAVRIYKEVR